MFGAGLAVVTGLLAFSAYQQFVLGLEPCPLCVLQRLAFVAVGGLCLLAVVQGPGRAGGLVYLGLILVAAISGGGVAARHVWLQQLPADQVPTCGPGLDYLLDTFPLGEALALILGGSGECAEVGWQFLGLSIPAWALVWFTLIALGALGWGWWLGRQAPAGSSGGRRLGHPLP